MAFRVYILTFVFLCIFVASTVSGYNSKDVKAWCSQTPNPKPCEYFLTHNSGQQPIKSESEFLKISMKLALERAVLAKTHASTLGPKCRDTRAKAAWEDCLKLYDFTVSKINETMDPNVKCSKTDAQTWLSTALTNLDTCRAGFLELGVTDIVLPLMSNNVSSLICNTLAINKVPFNYTPPEKDGFPSWVRPGDRKLLQSSTPRDNAVVAKDGSGNFRTIKDAINAASGSGRFVIYAKQGVYSENLEIRKKNVMLRGDGKGRTIITGSRSVGGGTTTFNSATVAAVGDGFIARGITFRNTAGANNAQAVALRSGSDLSVFYQCSFEGYQDTLYVHSNRQFYRDCDIYGTVDFIFGNAAAVLQNCNIFARRPRSSTNTITAQGRSDPNQNTGIIIHNSRVTAASDLRPVLGSTKTYLGRPWRQYSRTVFMKTSLDSLIDPRGWLEWNGNFALRTLFYAEFQNTGPGASTSRRVTWPGFRVLGSASEASRFTVGSFIAGSSWIPSTNLRLSVSTETMTTKKKSEAANEDQTRENKRKSVSSSAVKSQKEKPVVVATKEAKSSKEEEDLLLDSGTDSDYDGDSLSGSLNSDDFDSDFFDSEDDASQRETDGGDGDSSEDDELHGHEGSDDDEGEQVDSENDEEDGSDEGSEEREVAEESDSSEDEVAPRNTVGDVPLEWYKDEKHIGYDITGKKITKKEKQDKLDSFLATMDDSKNWRKIYDEYNDEDVELTKEESKLIRRMLKGEAPHADFDPYAPYVDWFKWDDAIHPLSSAPEPKRRFIPSKWEAKKVVKYVRAIRKGLIKFDKPEEEPNVYLLWGDDSTSDQKSKHLTYIPPPKLKMPGHEESYNPSLEYIPTEEEKASYELMYEEDRPKFIPKRFTSLRSIPAYENALKESFDRCLDLYLCPRVRKKRINIDPESLKPKLPSRKDLRPYPNSCYLEYKGHTGAVTSVSTDCSGQWIASGSADGSVRIWEVETGRCLKVWQFKEAVKCVAWNPLPDFPILAVAMGQDLIILNTELGTDEEQQRIEELLRLPKLPEQDEAVAAIVKWLPDETYGGIKITHFKNVSYVDWHPRGDYLSAVMSAGETRGVVIHQLSMHKTQRLPIKMRGLPVRTLFHPTHRGMFIIATKKNVRVFNLQKKELAIKKLETGLREISSMAIHPGGDNLIVGSKEGKMCWFDMDLSSKPYKTLKNHPKDITNVAFHRSYPLFASCSEDSTAYVFHGKVYSDLNENPLIVPLEILRGHSTSSNRGVLDCKFHPRQPWLFTAGADSIIKLYCH